MRPDGTGVFFYVLCRVEDEQELVRELATLTDDRQSFLALPIREVEEVGQRFAASVEEDEDEGDGSQPMSDEELRAELEGDDEAEAE